MNVRETVVAGIPVIHIEGEIDLAVSPDLRAVLKVHVAARTPALALDLAGVTYIDSSGLATMIEYLRSTHKFHGRLALAGLDERVRTIFDLARLGEVFTIVGTVEEARAALQAPPA